MPILAWVVTSLFAFPMAEEARIVGEGTTVHTMRVDNVMSPDGLGYGPTMFILWAPWCGQPCDDHVKSWDARARATPSFVLSILALQGEGADPAADVTALRAMTAAPIVLVPDAELTSTWKIPADIRLPATFAVDGGGDVHDDFVIGKGDAADAKIWATLDKIGARPLGAWPVELDDPLPVVSGSKKKSLTLRALLPADRRPLFVITWSAACGLRCDRLAQRWSKAQKKLGKKGLRVLVVDVGEPATKRLKKLKLTVPVVRGDLGEAGTVFRIDADGQVTAPFPDDAVALAVVLRPLSGAGEQGTLGAAVRSAVSVFQEGAKLPSLEFVVVAGPGTGAKVTTTSLLEEKPGAVAIVPLGACDERCLPEAQAWADYQKKYADVRVVVWVESPGVDVAWWTDAGLELPLHEVGASAAVSPAWLRTPITVIADGKGIVRRLTTSPAEGAAMALDDLLLDERRRAFKAARGR